MNTAQIYEKVESIGKIYFHSAETHSYMCAKHKYTKITQMITLQVPSAGHQEVFRCK